MGWNFVLDIFTKVVLRIRQAVQPLVEVNWWTEMREILSSLNDQLPYSWILSLSIQLFSWGANIFLRSQYHLKRSSLRPWDLDQNARNTNLKHHGTMSTAVLQGADWIPGRLLSPKLNMGSWESQRGANMCTFGGKSISKSTCNVQITKVNLLPSFKMGSSGQIYWCKCNACIGCIGIYSKYCVHEAQGNWQTLPMLWKTTTWTTTWIFVWNGMAEIWIIPFGPTKGKVAFERSLSFTNRSNIRTTKEEPCRSSHRLHDTYMTHGSHGCSSIPSVSPAFGEAVAPKGPRAETWATGEHSYTTQKKHNSVTSWSLTCLDGIFVWPLFESQLFSKVMNLAFLLQACGSYFLNSMLC